MSYYQTAADQNGYGGIAYYSRESCFWEYGGSTSLSECTNNYENSDIKYVVDSWAKDKTFENDLAEDSIGYKARLITQEEYKSMTREETYETPTEPRTDIVPIYEWQYSDSYNYWTMSTVEDEISRVWFIRQGSGFMNSSVICYAYGDLIGVIRPVIVLYKSALN